MPEIQDRSGTAVTHDGDIGMLQRLRREDGFPVYVAAGLGINGTRGALQYLFANWRDLAKEYGNHDFAVALGFPGFRQDPFGSQRPTKLLALHRQEGEKMSVENHAQNTGINLNQPFAKAVEALRRDALSRDGYDPVRLILWGQMMAVSVLEMLKAVEARFGREGQQVCTEALAAVGYRMAEEGLEGVEAPEGMTDVQAVSRFATWVNEQLYASVEKPSIDSADACSFDILWCPHQDVYGPFDCRVQRYLVEGMLRAGRDKLGAAMGTFDVRCDSTMPAGAPTCHFTMWRAENAAPEAWEAYSRQLEERALSKREGGKTD
jgi:hypothetical protein